MVDKRHRELTPEDSKKISDTYHSWRGELKDTQQVEYQDVAGFCKAVKLDGIRKNGHMLTPGRYVGAEKQEEDNEEFEQQMKNLTSELVKQIEEGRKLDEEITKNFEKIGYVLQ